MEYIEHGHLGTYIAGYQKQVDAKEITTQILEGLVVLHERKICHRDLKPQVGPSRTQYINTQLTDKQNILVAALSPNWVKITDFGISKCWVGTSLNTHYGTTIYRAPEQLGILLRQLRGTGNSYTNRIDIWALGAIAHEMRTLEIPSLETWVEDSDLISCMSVVENIVDTGLLYGYCHGKNPFPSASLRSHGVPEDGIEFVKGLMVVNPSERFSATAALASKWLVETEGSLLICDSPIAGPLSTAKQSAVGNSEELNGVSSVAEMARVSSRTESQYFHSIEHRNDQQMVDSRVHDLLRAPTQLLGDQVHGAQERLTRSDEPPRSIRKRGDSLFRDKNGRMLSLGESFRQSLLRGTFVLPGPSRKTEPEQPRL